MKNRTTLLPLLATCLMLWSCDDSSKKTESCGNGLVDMGEECDGSDLAGNTCVTLGLDSGSLACAAGCRYDLSDCVGNGVCGNGVLEPAETCDGSLLDGQDCASIPGGFTSGTLACDEMCQFDTSACRTPSQQLQAVIDQGTGTGLSLPVKGVFVTYVLPPAGTDPVGFFVQAEPLGPALWVNVSPTELSPGAQLGDLVSFVASDVETVDSMVRVTALTGWSRTSAGHSVASLVQDLSGAADLVSGVGGYTAELLTLDATVVGALGSIDGDHSSALIATSGLPTGDPGLKLRLPTVLNDALELEVNCTVTVNRTPLWRSQAEALVSIWDADDIIVTTCPRPHVMAAVATGNSTVVIYFNRTIEPSTITNPTSQFTFTGGVTASTAVAGGKTITLTTSTMTPGTTYSVTVAGTVEDLVGGGIDPGRDTAPFGFAVQNGLIINEVDYDNVNEDLTEFVEIFNGGSSDVVLIGFSLMMVNGSSNTVWQTVDLGPAWVLSAGQYLVVGSDAALANAAAGALTLSLGSVESFIQNGAPDGLALVDTNMGLLVDALSYEGSLTAVPIPGLGAVTLVEGTTCTASDSGEGSLCRLPNGADSGVDGVDWGLCTTLTPGASNVP